MSKCRALATGIVLSMLGLVRLAGAEEPLRWTFLFDDEAAPRQVRTLHVPSVPAAPRIDGRVQPGEWPQAPLVQLSPDHASTRLAIAFDQDCLYLAVQCDELPGRTPLARQVERDQGRIWTDDAVELWLAPAKDSSDVRHFIVNRAGSIYDARRGQPDFNPDWRRAVHAHERGWSLELALPRAALLDQPGPDAAWPASFHFDLARVGPELSGQSWSGQHGQIDAGLLLLEGMTDPGPDRAAAAHPGNGQLRVTGSALVPQPRRLHVRPGERYLYVPLTIVAQHGALDQLELEARLYALGEEQPRATTRAVPTAPRTELQVDLRSLDLRDARLVLQAREQRGQFTSGLAEFLVHAQPPVRPVQAGQRVQVQLDLPPNLPPAAPGAAAPGPWPVTFGLPMPAGALWDAQRVRLVNDAGDQVPAQIAVAGRWAPGGAIKWLRVDALVEPAQGCHVEFTPPAGAAAPEAVALVEHEDRVIVRSAGLEYELGLGHSPLRSIRQGGRLIASSEQARGLYLIDQNGRLGTAVADEQAMRIEARGPVAACVRFEGWYRTADGEPMARHITRVEIRAGEPLAKLTHTLVLTQDTRQLWFREVGWELRANVGAAPAALFALAPEEPDRALRVALDAGGSAFILQESHYRFNHGENRFRVAAVNAGGGERDLHTGAEAGDWAALAGRDATLLLGCRDLARQHPKELLISPDRVVLRLFSPRAGEELDFRAPTLVQKWGLEQWVQQHNRQWSHAKRGPEHVQRLREFDSNALGWAKTHELFIGPVEPALPAADIGRRAARLTQPLHALVDPWWTYRTLALGPNYPRDPQRFPAAEAVLEETFQRWVEQDAAWGEHGFIDYFGGPHFAYVDGRTPYLYRYLVPSYDMRAQLWLVYARGGGRAVRDFVFGINRARMDNAYKHWGRLQGMNRMDYGLAGEVPFYWADSYQLTGQEQEFANNFIWMHYLTGDRRARDVLEMYGHAFKRTWTPAYARKAWRVTDTLSVAAQLYAFTEDPVFRHLAEQTLAILHDADSAVGLTKRAYKSSTYKNYQDIRSLVEAWDLLGDPRLLEICLAVGRSEQRFPYPFAGYTPVGAFLGNFLYHQNGNLAQAQSLAHAVGNLAAVIDPLTGAYQPDVLHQTHRTSFVFELGYALDVLARAPRQDQGNYASWVLGQDPVGTASVVVRKGADAALVLEANARQVTPLRLNEGAAAYDLQLISVAQRHDGKGQVVIPRDAPGGDYELRFQGEGTRQAFASAIVPMVLVAPDYWKTPAPQRPPVRCFFHVPANAQRPGLYLSAPAVLLDPQQQTFAAQAQGWIDLPADRPGLWSFLPLREAVVRVRGLPPVFAFNDPEAFFLPAMDWPQGEPLPTLSDDAAALYLPVAADTDNQALNLVSGRRLQVAPGAGSSAWPGAGEGTIEFFLRPRWNSFDGDIEHDLLSAAGLHLAIQNDVLHVSVQTDGPLGAKGISLRRFNTLLAADRWTHIALVWGRRRQAREEALVLELYVNGRRGSQAYTSTPPEAVAGQRFSALPALNLGGQRPQRHLHGLIDGVRISNIQRYRNDFLAPMDDRQLSRDGATAALLRLDGDLICAAGAAAEVLAPAQ